MGNTRKYFGKDINPQALKFSLTMSAANTFTEKEIKTPVVQSLGNERALVMEILKVHLYVRCTELRNILATEQEIHITDRTVSGMKNWGNSECIMHASKSVICIDTAATDATLAVIDPNGDLEFDFTDGNGNGILYGKSAVFIGMLTSNFAAAGTVAGQILYRLKEVSASELLGIIQS